MSASSPAKSFGHGKGDLTQGPVKAHLIRLSVPMIWGILAMVSFQLVDTFFIAMLGTEPLAAITFTFPVTFVIFSLILGQSIAMSSVLSRQIGEGNMTKIRRIATHGILLAFMAGIFFSIAGLLLMKPIFKAMGADDSMMPIIADYMVIWFAGSIFITVPMIGNAAIRATGDTFVPAMIMLSAAIINVILDPIMIFGLFGFPRLEVQGAAISTVLANAGAMIAGLYVLYAKKKLISRSRWHLKLFSDSAKKLLKIAIPAGFASIIAPITGGIITTLLAAHSTEAVAAYGVVSRIEAFSFVIIMALAVGMAPIIGQNWGAGKFDRVHETLRLAFLFATLWSLFVSVILIAFSGPVARLFSEDEAVIASIKLYFFIVAGTYAFSNIVQGWSSAFNAMGMPKRSFMMTVIKMLLFTVPLAALGAHFYGPTGIFGAIAVVNIGAGVAFHLLNRRFVRAKTLSLANLATAR